MNDLLCNFAGLLVVIQIDDMIGEWAVEYMIRDDNKFDEDFLILKLTNVEYEFAEKLCLFLMFAFLIFCSYLYYCLHTDTNMLTLSYLTIGYTFFLIWPLV